MLAVEPAHRQLPAQDAGAKAAPSHASHDVFASIFEAARAERVQPKQKAPNPKVAAAKPQLPKPASKTAPPADAKVAAQPADTDTNTSTADANTSSADVDQECADPTELNDQAPADPAPEKTNHLDAPREPAHETKAADATAENEFPKNPPVITPEAPHQPAVSTPMPVNEVISQVPVAQPTPTKAQSTATTTTTTNANTNTNVPPPTTTTATASPAIPMDDAEPDQNADQSATSAHTPESPATPRYSSLVDRPAAPNTKTPKPVAQAGANAPKQGNNDNTDVTAKHDHDASKSDPNGPKTDPTIRSGLESAPGIQNKGGELPVIEHAKANEITVRPNGVPEQANNVFDAPVKPPPVQHAERVQSPVAVQGGGITGNVDLNEPKSIGELANVLRAASNRGGSSMLLQLDPPELGQVRIDVRLQQQLLTLRIDAETPAGQQALQSRLSDLRSALEQQGLQLGHVSVELRPSAGSEQQFHDPQQHQGWDANGEFHPGGSQHSSSQDQPGAFGASNPSEIGSEMTAAELLEESNGQEIGNKRVDLVV